MRKNYGGFKFYYIFIFIFIIEFFILVGTFADLSFARAIYSPDNFYADFFEYLGTLPASIIVASSGPLIYYYLEDTGVPKYKNIKKIIFIIITLLVGFLWGYDAFHKSFDNILIPIIIGEIVIICTNLLFLNYLKDGENKEQYLKKALIIIICGIITFAITFLLKDIVVRPRYMGIRLALNNDESYFKNWYDFTYVLSKDLELLVKEKGSSYYIDSWPSGHASFSALIFLSLNFYNVKGNYEKNNRKIFIISLLLMLIIGISRLTDGHHYLSDIGFGYLIGLGTITLGFIILNLKEKEYGTEIINIG